MAIAAKLAEVHGDAAVELFASRNVGKHVRDWTWTTPCLIDETRAEKLTRFVDHPAVDWAGVLRTPEGQDRLDQLANEADEEAQAEAKATADWDDWRAIECGEVDVEVSP
jgi:hypothetical protein